MYFVDREKIEVVLQYMEEQLAILEKKNNWDSPIEKLALERIAHTVVESILDVGNAMIDGFIMRDPGSYEDIIDILLDEKVVRKDMSKDLKVIVEWRKKLVQEYTTVTHTELTETLGKVLSTLKQFPISIRHYLETELGPVSAFRN
ncbi:DUF86 domain-containing protein [Bacillus seohaeanensis]|uniref:DUF86 domain-containing protein n=1 Tax=Bacillus seohaeanensis TaxID=284580 RepID=A0ABW5RQ04_9BACI